MIKIWKFRKLVIQMEHILKVNLINKLEKYKELIEIIQKWL